MSRAGLKKISRTVRTKNKSVRRSYWVKSATSRSKGSPRSAAKTLALVGGTFGAIAGSTIGGVGGFALGGAAAHSQMLGAIRQNDPWAGAGNSRHSEFMQNYARHRPAAFAGHYAGAAAKVGGVGAFAGGAGGAAAGSAFGHLIGRAIDRRRAGSR